jgi:amidohydrolase
MAMLVSLLALGSLTAPRTVAQAPTPRASSAEVEAVYPSAYALYLDIHEHPELSTEETQTAAKMASRLRELGYQVTEHVGGNGLVAVMGNGAGPAIMLRTELDALPVEEKTGLPYASKVHAKDPAGHDVPVMHACGHDLHMAALFGTAAIMAHSKPTWHGTLVLIGQPAEETITGAKAMLADGFLTRFPRPDAGVALHVSNGLPAGEVGVGAGYRAASADSIRVTIYGKGAHGAAPEVSIDPVVIAARTVVALQTIVSREVTPGDAAVVTVGYIQAGTKNNIIPDHAELGLTVRSYNPETRKRVLASISRIVNAEAEAAGVERPPSIDHYESTDALYDDPALAQRLTPVLVATLGKQNVEATEPIMASEDYSYFVEAGIPSFFYWLGGAEPQKYAQARATGVPLPSNHSPLFAPDAEPALRTAIVSEVAVLRNLLSGSAQDLRNSLAEKPAQAQ